MVSGRAASAACERHHGQADARASGHGAEGAIYRYRYRYRTGIAWRDLPAEFGPWQTVWKRHHRFPIDGTWDMVLKALQVQADARGEIDWRLSVDSTSARVHQHDATASRSVTGATSHTGGAAE